MDNLQARVAKLNELDAKRTQGEWDYTDLFGEYFVSHIRSVDGLLAQEVLCKSSEANAQFIAAAPTAIQALNEAMALLQEAGKALAAITSHNSDENFYKALSVRDNLRNAGVIV